MDHKPLEAYKLKLKDLNLQTPANSTKIICPECKTKVAAAQINIQDKIAKCSACDSVFSFQQDISGLLNPQGAKQEILRPEGIDIFHYEDEMEITFRQPLTFIDVIPLALLTFLTFITTMVLFKKGTELAFFWSSFMWTLFLFPVYNLFQRKKHLIHILVDGQFIDIQWRPKKLVKNKRFVVAEIDQLYVKQVGGLYNVYMVVNGAAGQKHVKLITELKSKSKARFIEQEIEAQLQIQDRPVPDEEP